MSADNGVYLGHFADGEVRVIHAQAIDNVFYPDGENAGRIVDYFGQADTFTDVAAARVCAFRKADEILEDDFPLEYGISDLHFSKPFSEYEREVIEK